MCTKNCSGGPVGCRGRGGGVGSGGCDPRIEVIMKLKKCGGGRQVGSGMRGRVGGFNGGRVRGFREREGFGRSGAKTECIVKRA